jgi:hypothetical protein
MFNKILIATVMLCLLFAGCSNDNGSESNKTLVPVTVHVNDFTITQEEFPTTRSTDIGSYATAKAITLAFYKNDGTEMYKHTQFKSDNTTYTTFGEFTTSLPMGSYTMVVIGYGQGSTSHAVTLTSPTAAGFDDYVRETFVATQAVSVINTDEIELTATLDRIMAKVSVISTDGRSAAVTSIRTTFSGGSRSFNPSTGLATDDTGFANTVATSVAVGTATTISSGVFLATDEQIMDITIETLDANDNVLFSKTVKNVPLKRNRITTLTGAMYGASTSSGSFKLNTDWLPGNTINF